MSLRTKIKLNMNSRNKVTLTKVKIENARKIVIEWILNTYTSRKYSVN